MKMKKVYVFSDFETTGLFDFKEPSKIVYPIEVGLIFTDENYVIYNTYSSLIKWFDLVQDIKLFNNEWPDYSLPAYYVHNIDVYNYLINSKDYMEVASDIYGIIHDIKTKIENNNKERVRFILMSDNIQFEFKLMEFLLSVYAKVNNLNWPFHYCGYDTSELLIRTGVGDPIPEHRAFRDASLLHQHMIRAVEKINGFKNGKETNNKN